MLFHIRIFLQTLRRNYTYSAINIAGLAIGLTASVFIFLWVYHERSFDRFYPDAERIYKINTILWNEGEDPLIREYSALPFVQACQNEIPEIESTALMSGRPIEIVTVNNTVFSVKGVGYHVDKSWLEMFNSQLVDGSFENFGNHPFSVALTETEAKKYFGYAQATGQTVRIGNDDYTVRAIVKDNPSNSTFRFHIMASTDAVLSDPNERQYIRKMGKL